jgi:hypothetical protein
MMSDDMPRTPTAQFPPYLQFADKVVSLAEAAQIAGVSTDTVERNG